MNFLLRSAVLTLAGFGVATLVEYLESLVEA